MSKLCYHHLENIIWNQNMSLVCHSKDRPKSETRAVSWAGLFGSGSAKSRQNLGLNSGLKRAFCLRCTKI